MEQARICLEEATAQQASLLAVALQKSWLNPKQVQEIQQLSQTGSAAAAALDSSHGGHMEARQIKKTPMPMIGERLGDFHIKRILGRGAMGIVYGAERGGVEYALKIVVKNAEPEALVRFEREAQSLAAVDQHPNIVRIHSFEHSNDQWFFVLDLIEGESLERRLERGAIADFDWALEVIEKMAAALYHVHQNDIIHRDLKAGNILIRSEDNEPFLADFGLVKRMDLQTLTRAGESLGTPLFMSPEQIQGEAIDPRTDLWSLGIVLYQMCTGVVPFQGETLSDLACTIVNDEPKRPRELEPDIPKDVEAIILCCLQKDLKLRYSSGAELARDCALFRKGAAIDFASSRKIRNRTIALIILIMGFLLVIPVSYRIYSKHETEQEWQRELDAVTRDLQSSIQSMKSRRMSFIGKYLLAASSMNTPEKFSVKTKQQSQLALEQSMIEFDKTVAEATNTGLEALAADIKRRHKNVRLMREGLLYVTFHELYIDPARSDQELVRERLPRSFIPLLKGFRWLLLKDWDKARAEFSKAKSLSDEVSAMGRYGEMIVNFQLKNWESVLDSCARLESNIQLAKLVSFVRKETLKEALFQLLSDPKSRPQTIQRTAQRWEKLFFSKRDKEALWQAFNSDIEQRFKKRERTESLQLQLLRCYFNIKSLKRHYPSWKLPPLDRQLHLTAAALATQKKERASAYYHYLQVRKLDPEFKLPRDFRMENIPKIMTEAFAERNNKKSLELWFDMVLAASRSGLFVPYVTEEWILQLYRRGVVQDKIDKAPDDPAAKYWRGRVWLAGLRGTLGADEALKMVKQCIADLSYVIESPSIAKAFVAIAMTERICCRLDLPNASQYLQISLDELKIIETLPHPSPDQVYLVKYDLIGGRVPLKDALAVLKLAQKCAQDRWLRTQNHELAKNRPRDAPLIPLNEIDYGNVMSSIYRRRAELYLLRNRFKEAVPQASQAVKFQDDDNAVYTLGKTFLYNRDFKSAEALLKRFSERKQRPLMQRLIEELQALKRQLNGGGN
jgi:serine/threonine protein kinase